VGSPSFDTSRARFGDLIAAGGGLVLFISLFLNWYSVNVKAGGSAFGGSGLSQSESGTGWEALSFIDILLFACAVAAITVAILRVANMIPPRGPVSPGIVLLGVGALATLLVLFRIISIPHGDVPDVPGVDISFGREFGIFLALLAAIAMTIGGWLGWNEEGRPSPGGAGVGRGGAGPIGGPPQQAYSQPPVQQGPPATQQQPVAQPQQPVQQQAQPPAPASTAKADWYPDPRGEKRLRYFDGTQWTDHVAD
jgi:hypothetical protein